MKEDTGANQNDYGAYLQGQQTNKPQVQPGQQLPAATTNGSTPPPASGAQTSSYTAPDWSQQSNWTADNINAYAKSRGVDNFSETPYWISKGQELYDRGKEINNPNYAFDRLAAAESFGGGGGNAGGASGGAYVPGQGVPGMGTVFGGGGTTGSSAGNSLYDFLMQRAHQGLAVDPNDPIIKNQVGAFGATQTRNARDMESAAAERASGGQANQEAVRRSAGEKVGQATSNYQGQLMSNEVAARRQEIQSALQGAQGFLTDTQRMQLQEELAQLQLGQGAYQFDTNMQFMNSPLYGGNGG